jgi:hypothetical protein
MINNKQLDNNIFILKYLFIFSNCIASEHNNNNINIDNIKPPWTTKQ